MKKFLFLLVVAALVVIPTLSVQAETQTCVNLQNNLQIGSSDTFTGNEVTQLQNFLINKYGVLSGIDESTGYFGRLTSEAVMSYQREKGITPVSGYVGPLTRQTIQSETCTTVTAPTVNNFQLASSYMIASSTNPALDGAYICGTGFSNNMFSSLFWTSPSGVRQSNAIWYTSTSLSPANRMTVAASSDSLMCAFLPIASSTQNLLNQGWTADVTLYSGDSATSLEVELEATSTPTVYQYSTTTSSLVFTGMSTSTVLRDGMSPVIITGSGINLNTRVYLGSGGNRLSITPKNFAYNGTQLTFVVSSGIATGTYPVSLSNNSLVFATSSPASNLTVKQPTSTTPVNIATTTYSDTTFTACGTGFADNVYASVVWTSSTGVRATSTQTVWYVLNPVSAGANYKISTTTNAANDKCVSIPFSSATQAVLSYWSADFTLYNGTTGNYDIIPMPKPSLTANNFNLECSVSTSTVGNITTAVYSASTSPASTGYTYSWIGDGISLGETASTTSASYSTAGQKRVTVRVNNSIITNNTKSCSVTLNVPKADTTSVVYPSCGSFANQAVATSTIPNVMAPYSLCSRGELDETSFGHNGSSWYWSCIGQNTIWPGNAAWCFTPRSTVSNTPIGGVCGSANNRTSNAKPTANLCLDGSTPTVLGSGPWTWSCAGSNNGSTASCSAPKVATWPTCGSFAISAATSTSPALQATRDTTQLCSTGTYGNVSGWNGDGNWYWSCVNSSNNTSWCFRPRTANSPVATDGACGSANNSSRDMAPVTDAQFCLSGSKQNFNPVGTPTNSWTWTCSATNGGQPASCSANKLGQARNGACGSADNQPLSTTPSGSSALCNYGSPSDVTFTPNNLSGTYSWSCNGTGGGIPDTCQAPKIITNTTVTCGQADGNDYSSIASIPVASLCSNGLPPASAVTKYGDRSWKWTCGTETCLASIVYAVCGSSATTTGGYSSAPTDNFCETGSKVSGPAVTGDGTNRWWWGCNFSGSNAAPVITYCFAPKSGSAQAEKTSFFGAVITSIADLFR